MAKFSQGSFRGFPQRFPQNSQRQREERLLVLWRSVSAWADLILQWATENALIGVATRGLGVSTLISLGQSVDSPWCWGNNAAKPWYTYIGSVRGENI